MLGMAEALDSFRGKSWKPAASENKYHLLEALDGYKDISDTSERIALCAFAADKARREFVATVDQRNSHIMLSKLRLVGVPFFLAGHVWVSRTRHWQSIEPFYQGDKVVLSARARKYCRRDGSRDYTLQVEGLRKLWPKSNLSAP
jgi:hypothetical protein